VRTSGVDRAPLAVSARHPVQDRVMHVQLRITVPARMLQKRRHHPLMRIDIPARRMLSQRTAVLAARDRAVVVGPAEPGLVLQVLQRRCRSGADRALDLARQS